MLSQLLIALTLFAADPAQVIAEASKDTLSNPEAENYREFIHEADDNPYASAVRRLAGESAAHITADPTSNATTTDARSYRIFVSQSLSDQVIRTAVAQARDYPGTVITVRGLEQDQSLIELVGWWREFDESGSIPFEIHPPSFVEASIDGVPAVAVYKSDTLRTVAPGTVRIDAVVRRLPSQSTRIAAFGPVEKPSEMDLMEQMRKRAEAIDWDEQKARSERAFWARVDQNTLPTVTQDRQRSIDPTFEVTQTISDTQGTVIALAGQQVNPLDYAPFDRQLVIFDARVDSQWHVVEPYLTATVPVLVLIVGADSMEEINGWKARSGNRVALLTPPVRQRFAIQRVPTIVTAADRHYVVQEIAP